MRKKYIALFLVLAFALSFCTMAYAQDTVSTDSLTLSAQSLAVQKGESAALTVSDGSSVTWTSGNPGVAAVGDGTVTGVSLGRTTVTATASDGRSATCVVNVVLKGIDVSSYQGTVDWAAVKAGGVDYAILRDGYGNEHPETQTDSTFATNYDSAVANGLKVGAYHVSYATTEAEAQQEAQFCLSILNGRKFDYPVYLDLESWQEKLQDSQLNTVITTFCNAMIKAGYRTGVYANTSLLNKFKSMPSLNAYDLWVAHHDALVPNYSGSYTMWQYSSAGSVPGVNGTVDMDYSYQEYPLGQQTILPSSGTAATVDASMVSDTGAAITLKVGKTYQFKFTPKSASDKPSFSTGNTRVIKTVLQKKVGASYYYKIQCVGRGCTSVYSVLPKQKAVRRCLVTVA